MLTDLRAGARRGVRGHGVVVVIAIDTSQRVGGVALARSSQDREYDGGIRRQTDFGACGSLGI